MPPCSISISLTQPLPLRNCAWSQDSGVRDFQKQGAAIAFGAVAVGVVLVGALFDPEPAIRVDSGLTVFAEGVGDRLARIVFAHPGVDVLHVDSHDLA